jgi:hypothetical protein
VSYSTQFKKKKNIWTLSSISVKTHQMQKIQTHRYSLKYKKVNIKIGQLWSVVNFFVENNSIIFD